MNWIGTALGAVVGALTFGVGSPFVIAGTSLGVSAGGAIAGAYLGNQLYDQPKAAQEESSKYRKAEERAAAAGLAFQRELAGQQYELTEKQMKLQMGQQTLETLADAILKDPEPPQVYTLPPTWQPGLTDQINMAIDKMFRG